MIKETWFIEEISPWDMEKDSVCLHLTNYKLPESHEELERNVGKSISKLRWVILTDYIIEPGKASGNLFIEEKIFKLTYAWGGVNSAEDYKIRESYTVQVKGDGCEEYFTDLANRINSDEGVGKGCIGGGLFQLMNIITMGRIKPYENG